MQEPSPSDTQAEAVRVQRVLEETLDRYAGRSEAERTEALVDALRAELGTRPAAARAPLLAALRSFTPPEAAVAPSVPTAALRELEAEVERLRRDLAARELAPPVAAQAPAGPPGDLARRVAAVLLGTGRDAEKLLAGGAEAEARLVAILAALVEFAGRLGRVYLGATTDAERTMAGRTQALIADALEGRIDIDDLTRVLEQIYQQIGGQLLAFREACDSGAKELLKQLAPAAVETASAKGATVVGGRRPFFYRECWEWFEKRYEELRTADHLFESYFNGAFRRALLRQGQGGAERKGAR